MFIIKFKDGRTAKFEYCTNDTEGVLYYLSLRDGNEYPRWCAFVEIDKIVRLFE